MELSRLIDERCARFGAGEFDTENVAFTHVQKMGGTSLAKMLHAQSRRKNKTIMDLWSFVRGTPWITMESLRKKANAANVVHGHINAAWLESPAALGWQGGNFSLVTIVRNPIDTLQSQFRYNGGFPQMRLKEATARNMTLQEVYDGWIQRLCEGNVSLNYAPYKGRTRGAPRRSSGGGGTRGKKGHPACAKFSQALSQHAPPKVFVSSAKDERWASPLCFRCNPAPPGSAFLGKKDVLDHIALRYSVVGVLERRVDTMKVMRCRIPWITATALPRENPTPLIGPRLSNDRSLAKIRQIVADDFELINVSNRILSADLACCKSRRARRP